MLGDALTDESETPELPPGLEGSSLSGNTVFSLSKAVVLVVDDNPFSLRLTTQTLLGFGVQSRHQATSVDDAIKLLKSYPIDLLVVDCDMPEKDGYDLVNWVRRYGQENAWIPVIMVAGHTPQSKVIKARDCGANFIVARPLSPVVLLERILWVARDPRPMLQAGDYFGPDRRFQDVGPPEGIGERRQDLVRSAQLAALQARTEETQEAEVRPAQGAAS